MSAFLKPVRELARQSRINWRIVPCGGRQAAYDAFVHAMSNEPEVFNILLVDSEDPVSSDNPWTHLRNRPGDGWVQPAGADESRCHLMVICMEAWFLADPATLKRHFGGNFDDRKLPPPTQAESRTKQDINGVLKKATANTPAREYRKLRDGVELLKCLNPAEVRKHCRWCDRLFATLERTISDQATR
jgi:hypothetical protein